MAYVRTVWKARAGNGLERFVKVNETSSEVYLTNEPVSLTEPGTNFSPENMNKIEQGLIDAHQMLDDQKDAYDALFSEIAAESQAREQADADLQAAITAEAQARGQGDAALRADITAAVAAEAQARAQGDTTLQNNITAEAQARAQGDTTLQNNITAEAQARAQGDTVLQNNITAEAEAREQGDATLAETIAAKARELKTEIRTIAENIKPSILPINGYFGLYVNSSGALVPTSLELRYNPISHVWDLISTVADGEENRFRYEPETGNLYYMTGAA